MRSRILWVCLLALGVFVVAGCATARVPVYSDAKDLQGKKHYEEAISRYKQYIDQNKDSSLLPYAQYQVAQCYLGLGDKDKAVAQLEALVTQCANCKIVMDKPKNNPVLWAQEDLKMLKEHPEILMPAKPASK